MSKITALTVTMAVLGAAGMAGAARADSINWNAIAQCESGGNWAANTGNGDYGGLQISEATWEANGGVGLPSQASPAQQIAVGKRIMSSQGPDAWPSCASRGDGGATAAPVGSLTQYLTALFDDSARLGDDAG